MKKQILLLLIIIAVMQGCSSKINWVSKDGNKSYKKADGNFAQSEWVTIDGNEYFFDMNGYLQTNKWIEDKYYVDNTGKKLVKSWYEDKENNKKFYLSSDGTFMHDTLATISGKDYYFDKDGSVIVDKVFKNSDGKYMISDANGVINNSNGIVAKDNKSYFVDKMGIIFTDGWKEINGNWYYFSKNDGSMKRNEWFEATYYFGEDGKMLKNGKSPEGYEVDSEGKVLEEYKPKLMANDFKYIYQEYCKYPWAEVGEDGSYLSLDSNPNDVDNKYSSSTMYLRDTDEAIEKILKIFNFPDYVHKRMGETTYADGKQEEKIGDVTVSWKYHPDKGLEVMFIKSSQ